MTLTAPPAAPIRGGGSTSRQRALITTFAVTQTVGYGVLYYSFAVLLQPIARDLRTSAATVAGAMTLAIVVTALAAIPVGRWLDRHGGRALLTAGSLIGVGALVGWSQARTIGQLYAAFVLIGLASAMSLYEAAFSVIVSVVGPARRTSSILAVTVVAGFASSIFLPLTGLLLAQLGWRNTLLVLAGVLATIAVPAHLLAVPGRRSRSGRPASSGPAAATALRDAGFWLLTSSFAVHAAATSAMGVLLVGYLVHAGHSTTAAATLAGLLGVLSVTGRLATTGFARRYSMARVTAAMFAVQGAGAAALPLAGPRLAGAAACVTAFGLGFGIATIAKPAILADRYGTSGFATIAAAMSVPVIAAKAAAPLVAASLAPTVFTTSVSLLCLLSAVLLALSARPPGPHSALVRPNRTD